MDLSLHANSNSLSAHSLSLFLLSLSIPQGLESWQYLTEPWEHGGVPAVKERDMAAGLRAFQ